MDNFWAEKEFGNETVKAALQFVSNTNALIIDLRTNTGGLGEVVALIIGYSIAVLEDLKWSLNQ